MKNIIVIAGPTGVGKTKLSVELAKLINAEIINADSMQIYKDDSAKLDIILTFLPLGLLIAVSVS